MNGSIAVICGPMYSGKTDALLRIVRREAIRGTDVLLFRPDVDNRTDVVTSRAGATYPSCSVNSSIAILDIMDTGMADLIAIDEAQFFDMDLPGIVGELANDHHKRVIVSGLDRDFLGRPFGPMGDLLVMADDVTKLTAVCMYEGCKEDAPMTQRLIDGYPADDSSPLVLIGGMGDETYEARCRRHYGVAKKQHETTAITADGDVINLRVHGRGALWAET